MLNREFEGNPSDRMAMRRDASIKRADIRFATLCANVLKAKGFYVQQDGDTIMGDSEVEALVRLSTWSPEGVALRSALSGIDAEPNVDACRWDEDTKRRVGSFYFDQHAVFVAQEGRIDMPVNPNPWQHQRIQETVEGYQEMAEMLRGDLKPLTPNDIQGLVEQIVDRESISG